LSKLDKSNTPNTSLKDRFAINFWNIHLISRMMSLLKAAAILGYLATFGSATPTNTGTTKRSPLGISLPPLIPSIPGVTEPLASNAPPLPILQLPTPALESPPFTASDIKPKKIGYFWTGSGDNLHKDFLATVSLDDVSQ
jgi:selenium-binding protein 1